MEVVEIGKLLIIGIFVTTTNQDGKSQTDIGKLWQQFYAQNIIERIPNKVGSEVYAVYTNYEGDHTQSYDLLIGCAVSSTEDIPKGMKGVAIAEGSYHKIDAEGENTQVAVFNAWQQIWIAK